MAAPRNRRDRNARGRLRQGRRLGRAPPSRPGQVPRPGAPLAAHARPTRQDRLGRRDTRALAVRDLGRVPPPRVPTRGRVDPVRGAAPGGRLGLPERGRRLRAPVHRGESQSLPSRALPTRNVGGARRRRPSLLDAARGRRHRPLHRGRHSRSRRTRRWSAHRALGSALAVGRESRHDRRTRWGWRPPAQCAWPSNDVRSSSTTS